MVREIEILNYLPNVIKEFREFKALAAAENPELLLLFGNIENALNDQFVMDATENGVLRWEKILKITPKATNTLDERKFRILTRLNQQLPYTLTTLKQQLESLCGVDGYSLICQNNIIKVRIALTAKSNFDDVGVLLQRVVPANMVVDLSLLYNQNLMFTVFTHSELTAYTHDQLRNEVIS